MVEDKELETWAKRLQILSSILGGGGIIGFLITFSTLTFCKRIFLALILVTGTLALFIFSRLLIKAKNRTRIELLNQVAPSSLKYLAKYARLLLVSELILILVCAFGVFLFAFPESQGIFPFCRTPEPCSITNLGWIEYQNDGLGSTISASPVIGSNCVLEISFDLKQNGWAAIYKKLQPNSLLQTQGIKVSYSGTGAANTLEFKLFEKDAEGVETLFYAEWDGATSTAGKTIPQEIYYTDLICKPNPSRCLTGAEPIDLKLVDRIDLSISNKPGQLPGTGKVTIESIQFIP